MEEIYDTFDIDYEVGNSNSSNDGIIDQPSLNSTELSNNWFATIFSNSILGTGYPSIVQEYALLITLAVQYLNTINSSIIKSLGSLRQSSCSCSKMAFTLEFVDTKDNPGEAIDKVFKITKQTVENHGYKTPCSFTIPVR